MPETERARRRRHRRNVDKFVVRMLKTVVVLIAVWNVLKIAVEIGRDQGLQQCSIAKPA